MPRREDKGGKVDLPPADTGEGEDLDDKTGVGDKLDASDRQRREDEEREHAELREAEDLDWLRTICGAGMPASTDNERARRLQEKGLLAPKAGEPGLWPTKTGELRARQSLKKPDQANRP